MPTKNFNPEGIDYLLFTPGPVNVPDWILKEMGKANDTHRSSAYREMHKSIRENMQKLLHTKNDILIFANSGSGVMEACVRNLIRDDETAVFFTCGDFGERWVKMAKANGKKVDQISVPWGKGFSPALVQSTLEKKKYPVVFIQLNETATGVMNPIDKIGPIVKKFGALLCVDAVSAMGGVDIRVDDWGIDIVLASVQKCFGIPPGLAICSISQQALDKAKTVQNRGMYFDFIELKQKGEKDNEHPVTPPIPQIRALKVVLDKLINEITPEKHYAAHAERTKMIQDWALQHGFKLFSEPGYESKTVVTIDNTLQIDTAKLVADIFQRGFKIVDGYGAMKGKNFRMAAMGWITKEQTQAMLKAATEALDLQVQKT